jgi:hypothetical protein
MFSNTRGDDVHSLIFSGHCSARLQFATHDDDISMAHEVVPDDVPEVDHEEQNRGDRIKINQHANPESKDNGHEEVISPASSVDSHLPTRLINDILYYSQAEAMDKNGRHQDVTGFRRMHVLCTITTNTLLTASDPIYQSTTRSEDDKEDAGEGGEGVEDAGDGVEDTAVSDNAGITDTSSPSISRQPRIALRDRFVRRVDAEEISKQDTVIMYVSLFCCCVRMVSNFWNPSVLGPSGSGKSTVSSFPFFKCDARLMCNGSLLIMRPTATMQRLGTAYLPVLTQYKDSDALTPTTRKLVMWYLWTLLHSM